MMHIMQVPLGKKVQEYVKNRNTMLAVALAWCSSRGLRMLYWHVSQVLSPEFSSVRSVSYCLTAVLCLGTLCFLLLSARVPR